MNILKGAEAIRTTTLEQLNPESQSSRGQFFTPLQVAQIMGELPRIPESGKFRILDPGAGSGILSAAIAERLSRIRPHLDVEIVAVENDTELLEALEQVMQAIEENSACKTKIIVEDFIYWAINTQEKFDLVIQNPPYAKLSSKGEHQKQLRDQGIQVPNIYSAFMALGIRLLNEGGQQVSITPRSWMNGAYYTHFRQSFTHSVGIDAIHTFESRSEVFGDTGVLQEAIILSVTKGRIPESVSVYSSRSQATEAQVRLVPYTEIVMPDFIHVPASNEDSQAVAWMLMNTSLTLADLGLSVSTGKVVDFRSRENLSHEKQSGSVPLIHATHIRNGIVSHPINPKKPEWFTPDSESTRNMILPAGAYVLIKRFSAKEERRRVVSGVWSSSDPVAFDNKTNFIHAGGIGIDEVLARGLSAYLNSTQLDSYFRVFSGHTQVNATDLRQLRFPSRKQLIELGGLALTQQNSIDQAVFNIVRQESLVA